MSRPRKYKVELTEEQVKELKRKIRSTKTSKTMIRRCQILLDLDEVHGKQMTREQCAKSNGVSTATVTNTIAKFVSGGLEEALSYKRSVNSDNSRRKVDGRAEAQLIALASGPPPEGYARWSLRLLAEKSKVILENPVEKSAIGRVLKKRIETT